MKKLTTLLTGAAMAVTLSIGTPSNAYADTSEDSEKSNSTIVGGATGATMGAVVAGPIGAVVGGVLGLMIGNDVEQEAELVAANQQIVNSQQELVAMQDELVAWQQKAMLQPVTIIEEAEPLLPELTTTIQFRTGLASIEPEYSEQLALISDLLLSAKDLSIHIAGYADPRGDAEQNIVLSKHRASAVQNALIEAGVEQDRITISAKGETASDMNASFESLFFDRKAVLMIAPKEKMLTAQN